MSEYVTRLFANYKEKLGNIHNNMKARGIFPNRTEPLKVLDFGAETVLKTIFRFRVAFLEELTVLFAYCYSKQAFETLILFLEEQQYIESRVSKEYGKYFIPTKKALYYLYTDKKTPFAESTIAEINFPKESRLIMRKCLCGIFSNRVFTELTQKYWDMYQKQELEVKLTYQKKQFLKQFVYSKTSKSAFSKKEAEEFAEAQLPLLKLDEVLWGRYKRFVQYFKEHSHDTELRFHFMRDYYNSIRKNRDDALSETIACLDAIINNVYSDKTVFFRNELYHLSNKSEQLQKEFDYSYYGELHRILRITKTSLLNTNQAGKSAEELGEITQHLEELDTGMEWLDEQRSVLKESFEAMVFERFDINDVAQFTEATITFDSLKEMHVYLTGISQGPSGKPCLEFSVIQPSDEEVGISYLFKRIESVFKFYRQNLLMFDYRIQVVTHSPKQKEQMEQKLSTVKEDFSLLPEYGLLLLAFDDMKVIATKQHLKERYEAFREVQKYI